MKIVHRIIEYPVYIYIYIYIYMFVFYIIYTECTARTPTPHIGR